MRQLALFPFVLASSIFVTTTAFAQAANGPQSNAAPGITMGDKPSAGPCQYSGTHTAKVRLTVLPSGRPTDEEIAASSGVACLDQQALKTVAGYHFNPAMKDGHAVATRIEIQVNYKRF